MCDKLNYIDSVVEMVMEDGRIHIRAINDNAEIRSQLILGSVQQVLASKFGRDKLDFFISHQWFKKERKKLKKHLVVSN